MDDCIRCAQSLQSGSSEARELALQVLSVCKTRISDYLQDVSSHRLLVQGAQPDSTSEQQSVEQVSSMAAELLVAASANESTRFEVLNQANDLFDAIKASALRDSVPQSLSALQSNNLEVRARATPELDGILAQLVTSAFPGMVLSPASAVPPLKATAGLSPALLSSCAQQLSTASTIPTVPTLVSALHLCLSLHDIAIMRTKLPEGLIAASPMLNFIWTLVPKLVQVYLQGEHGETLRQALLHPYSSARPGASAAAEHMTLGQALAFKVISALRDSCASLLPFDLDTLYPLSDLQHIMEATLTGVPRAGRITATRLSALHTEEAALTGDLPVCADLSPFDDMDLGTSLCSPVLGDSTLPVNTAKRMKMPAFWAKRISQIVDGLPDVLAQSEVARAFSAATQACSALAVCPLVLPSMTAVLSLTSPQATTDTSQGPTGQRLQGTLEIRVVPRKIWMELQSACHTGVRTLVQTAYKNVHFPSLLHALVRSPDSSAMESEKNQCSLQASAQLATIAALMQLGDAVLAVQLAQAVVSRCIPGISGLYHLEAWWRWRVGRHVQQLVADVMQVWSGRADLLASVLTDKEALQPIQLCLKGSVATVVSLSQSLDPGHIGQLAVVVAEGLVQESFYVRQWSHVMIRSALLGLPQAAAAVWCSSLASSLMQLMRCSTSTTGATATAAFQVQRAAAALVHVLSAPCCPAAVAQMAWSTLLPSFDSPPLTKPGQGQPPHVLIIPAHAQLFSTTIHTAPVRAMFRACTQLDKSSATQSTASPTSTFLCLAQQAPQCNLIAWLGSSIAGAIMLSNSIVEVVTGMTLAQTKTAPSISSVDTAQLAVYGPLLAELLGYLGDALSVAVPLAQGSSIGCVSTSLWRMDETSKCRGSIMLLVNTMVDWLKGSLDTHRQAPLTTGTGTGTGKGSAGWRTTQEGGENVPPTIGNAGKATLPSSVPGRQRSSQEVASSQSDAIAVSLASAGALLPALQGVCGIVQAVAEEPVTLAIYEVYFATTSVAAALRLIPELLNSATGMLGMDGHYDPRYDAVAKAVEGALACNIHVLHAIPATAARKPDPQTLDVLKERAKVCVEGSCCLLLSLAMSARPSEPAVEDGIALQTGSMAYVVRSVAQLLAALTAAMPSLSGQPPHPLHLAPHPANDQTMLPADILPHALKWAHFARAAYTGFFTSMHPQLSELRDAETGRPFQQLLVSHLCDQVQSACAASAASTGQPDTGLKALVIDGEIEDVLHSIGR